MNPRIVAISGPLRGSEFFIDEDDLYIGRGARSHIRLEDSLVSLKHCSLYWLGDRCMLQDRLSANGTFVNEFFFRAKLVVHGDHIRVGRSVFVYLLEDEVDEALLKLTPAERHWSDSHYPPTKPMCKYLVDRDPSKLRAPERLYVAVTRARHSVTFVFPEIGEPLNRADD